MSQKAAYKTGYQNYWTNGEREMLYGKNGIVLNDEQRCMMAMVLEGATASEIAHRQYVHINTVKYRLGRIAEIIGVKFTSTNALAWECVQRGLMPIPQSIWPFLNWLEVQGAGEMHGLVMAWLWQKAAIWEEPCRNEVVA